MNRSVVAVGLLMVIDALLVGLGLALLVPDRSYADGLLFLALRPTPTSISISGHLGLPVVLAVVLVRRSVFDIGGFLIGRATPPRLTEPAPSGMSRAFERAHRLMRASRATRLTLYALSPSPPVAYVVGRTRLPGTEYWIIAVGTTALLTGIAYWAGVVTDAGSRVDELLARLPLLAPAIAGTGLAISVSRTIARTRHHGGFPGDADRQQAATMAEGDCAGRHAPHEHSEHGTDDIKMD